ncbi:MAG: NGG1p interacting factor NIF3 [Candidatus Aquicultorales bacterium]
MKLEEIYQLAIEVGIQNDPRGSEEIERLLNEEKKAFDKLEGNEKALFDEENLRNPFADTRVLAGDPSAEITGILTGIDLEVAEVLLADRLVEKGRQVQLLLTHHPEGRALAGLADVMSMQADIWSQHGVPINIGDALIGARMQEVSRNLMPLNHNRTIDVAKLMGYAFMSCHTPADNMVTRFVQDHIDEKGPRIVRDVVDALLELPEYKAASKDKAGPMILVGDGKRRAGKVVVDMTGGTEGPEDSIPRLAEAGVGTIVQMHLGDKLRKKAEEAKMNVVIAGHIASDSIGLNLFLDKLETRGVEIIPCSGLYRISRA